MMKTIFATLAAMSLGAMAAAQELTVGYIYPAPVADVGWAKQLDLGREAVEAAYGDRVASVVVDSVPEGPDAARVMNQMVSDGAEFLMLGSFGYMNDGIKLGRANPQIGMIHASGFKQTDNFGTFTARNYEGFYLGGMAAGMKTESNVIGLVGAFPIPELVAEVNAITLAAQSVNSDAQVKVVWINTWFDPPKAQEAARALISQGADVLFSLHQDTPSVVTVAENEGVWVVNTGSDMSEYAPTWLLASVTNDWTDYFVREVGKKLDGSFAGADERGGLASGMVRVVAWSDTLPEEQLGMIRSKEAAFIEGTDHAFTGPIVDQSGRERVAAGEVLPDSEIFGMNWLVSTVDGTLPQ